MEAFGLACFFGLTALDDIKTKRIRLIEIAFFTLLGIIIDLYKRPYSLQSIVGGVLVGGGVFIFSCISKEKIGKGDGLIVMVAGLYLGFINTIAVVWLASILAAVIGLIMIRKHGDRMDLEIPFAPFLFVSYMIVFMIGSLGGVFR